MKNDRIPKQLLFSELAHGTRSRGRPKKRWKDCAKDDLKLFGMEDNWHAMTADRATWRSKIRSGIIIAENKLQQRREKRRERRHRVTDHL